MKERWEDWFQPHLILDTATVSPEAALRRILEQVAHTDLPEDDRTH